MRSEISGGGETPHVGRHGDDLPLVGCWAQAIASDHGEKRIIVDGGGIPGSGSLPGTYVMIRLGWVRGAEPLLSSYSSALT